MTLTTPILSLLPADSKGTSDLAGLFSKSVRKAMPEYDYASVPDRSGSCRVEEDTVEEQEEVSENPTKEKNEIKKHDRRAQVKHEDSKPRQINPETEARTVFVGNLPSSYKKKNLKKLFSKFGQVETVRFRGAARPDLKTTKKVAVIKNKFHEERNNINAYVRMSVCREAESACALNNSQVEGFTIRVDMAMKGKSHDNKRSVFLGNLDFKTEEEDVRKLFSKCGEVENVRIVRDNVTGIGKGFGYVNFVSEECVGLAVRLSGQEVCGRKVRVTRAVRKAKPGKVEGSGKSKMSDGPSKQKTSYTGSNAKKQNRSQNYKKKNISQPEEKSYQGLSSSSVTKPKRRFDKTVQKNKIIAKKLSS